jgi:hypothetical protein
MWLVGYFEYLFIQVKHYQVIHNQLLNDETNQLLFSALNHLTNKLNAMSSQFEFSIVHSPLLLPIANCQLPTAQ